MTKYPTAFAERNKITTAVIGLLALVVIFALTFSAESLPIVGGGKTYSAKFTDAGGLKEGNEVRVSGVKVGKVRDISLDRGEVVVRFRVKGTDLGDQTSAAIKVKTLLGQKFLALTPQGRGDLDQAIPTSRTTTPYDVNEAFSDLSTTVGEIDTEQLESSFDALSAAFENTPESVQQTVEGLSSLSRTVSSRDEELAKLFEATKTVSGTLKDRNAEFDSIINDGSALLGELERRRDAVAAMLDGTDRLGTELQGLVKDNEKALRPALKRLDDVARILQENQDNLDVSLKKLAPYYRVIASATGNGRWIDSYVCGLFEANGRPSLENDTARNCTPSKGGGR